MSEIDESYDVLVLGGGSAGTSAARAATLAGARVALFNDGELGGLCILRGCMPTKTMLHSAHRAHEARRTDISGVDLRLAGIDFASVMANKDAKVARFQTAKIQGIEAGGYDVVDARARFVAPDVVEAGGERYRFRSGAVLAVGSVHRKPLLEGCDAVDALSSDEALALTEQPESVIVVGSGAVGLELAQFFARVGTHVELVSRRRLLPELDPPLGEELERALTDEPNLALTCGTDAHRVERTERGVRLVLADGRAVEAERLLLATGRRPATDGLGLEAAGIELDRERVVHGPDQRTTNPRVWVAGDVTGERQILHVANWEGRAAGRNAAAGAPVLTVDHRLDLEVIFTDPPVAILGRTEAQARAAGLDPIVADVRFPETGRAITEDVRHGVGRLVAERSSGEILGAQLFGPRADDWVHAVVAVMHWRGTAADMLELPWYHPTVAEVLLSLARDLDAQVRAARASSRSAG